MAEKIDARQLIWCSEKLVRLFEARLAGHRRPCQRSFGEVGRAMMAVEGSELVIGYCWPLRSHLTKPLHPAFAILTFETGWLPDQEQAVRREKAPNLSHERSFIRSPEMVQRLADPDHVEWTVPNIDCLDEVLTT